MNTTGLRAKKHNWILEAIDADGYDITANTDKEKLQFIADCIKSEAIYPHNLKRHNGNISALIADHLQGLPSWLNIPFSNYDILELLKSWGYTFKNERAEDKAIANYWNATASIIMQLFAKHGIEVN